MPCRARVQLAKAEDDPEADKTGKVTDGVARSVSVGHDLHRVHRDDIDETHERLRKRGTQLVGEVVQYQDAYRLCCIRGPEGILVGLAQELS